MVLWISCASAQMALIGEALEGYSPCPNSILFISRYIDGPPSKENYWNGTISLDKWPNLSEIHISLTVDNPARIEIDEEVGRILVDDRTFHINAFGRQPDVKEVKFIVKGTQRNAFPNVEKLLLNNEDICNEPNKVSHRL